jgi:hypothetical protein
MPEAYFGLLVALNVSTGMARFPAAIGRIGETYARWELFSV